MGRNFPIGDEPGITSLLDPTEFFRYQSSEYAQRSVDERVDLNSSIEAHIWIAVSCSISGYVSQWTARLKDATVQTRGHNQA